MMWRLVGRRPAAFALVAIAMVAVTLPGMARADDVVTGSSGTDTSIAATPSELTVSGRGRFAELKVTVNQTRNLANQALSVTWAGGAPTTNYGGGAGVLGENFLQMFQCWGDDDGTNPDNPGPPPEQCQQGATTGTFDGTATGLLFQGNTLTRVIGRKGDAGFDPPPFTPDEFGGVSLPFRAVDGTVVPQWRDTSYNPQLGGGNYWLNPYFNIVTTNEIAGAKTAPNGKGADLFEATTGLESTGLGCGQSVQKLADGTTKVPRCWLVVVPRGRAADENEGANISPLFGVSTSPLAPKPWKNRISVPLEFNPVDSSCTLAADQRRIIGSELLSAAVASWQPALCAMPGLSPYAYGALSESSARSQLLNHVPGAPGMSVVARPISPDTVGADNPVVYAPLTLSGTVIGFNIERLPNVNFPAGQQPSPEVLAAENSIAGVRVAQINLTPRLVAKLLTQSYRSQVEIAASKPDYPWSKANPLQMVLDPDFLQFNPEFKLLRVSSRNVGGLVMPAPNSDAALQVWEWISADAEAHTWLAGAPDAWGMNVNPVFSTTATLNPQGAAFGDPLPDTYPKSDPYCYQAPPVGQQQIVAPPLCGLDWLPYTQGLRDAARATRAASDGARTLVNASPSSSSDVYKRDPPQSLGQRGILSITDTASAVQYGVQTARLSRAGDNAGDRTFTAPDRAGLEAGAQSMKAKAVAEVLEPSPTTMPSGAYPLTALTYAAVAPLALDATGRKEYAAFVDYAAGAGQTPGFEYGQLPPGYVPLPDSLRAQTTKAAATIRTLTAPSDSPGPSDSPAPDTTPTPTSSPVSTPTSSSTPDPAAVASPGAPVTTFPTAVPLASPPVTSPAGKRPPERIMQAVATPLSKVAATRFALPLLVVIALLSALGALEITKRRSRFTSDNNGALPIVDPGSS